MAWPNFHRETEERSTNRWQRRLQREHPTCTERINRSLRVRMEGWRQFGWGAKQRTENRTKKTERLPPFLPDGMVSDRSSPSRVRYAAQNAPLTAPGRSAHPPARKEREMLGKANQKQIKIYFTWTGLLMEGHFAH